MKILCLHGAGLNGDLMKRQLGPIIAGLDCTYEFVFVDGDIERAAAPGVPEQLPGPFFCYYDGLEGSQLRDACDLVDMLVEEEGPFDGFIGFSQGAAVGVSYMLDLAINQPDKDCPFRWALLFSSVLGFSPDPTYLDFEFALFDAQNEIEKTSREAAKTKNGDIGCGDPKIPESKGAMLRSPAARRAFQDEYTSLLRDSVHFAETLGWTKAQTQKFDTVTTRITEDDALAGNFVPRLYHPLLTPQRLCIPTVLCTGRNEVPELLRQSKVVQGLCQDSTSVHIEHKGGHDVPRDPTALQGVISATKRAIDEARWTKPRAML